MLPTTRPGCRLGGLTAWGHNGGYIRASSLNPPIILAALGADMTAMRQLGWEME